MLRSIIIIIIYRIFIAPFLEQAQGALHLKYIHIYQNTLKPIQYSTLKAQTKTKKKETFKILVSHLELKKYTSGVSCFKSTFEQMGFQVLFKNI